MVAKIRISLKKQRYDFISQVLNTVSLNKSRAGSGMNLQKMKLSIIEYRTRTGSPL